MRTLIKNVLLVPDEKQQFHGSLFIEDTQIAALFAAGQELPPADHIIDGQGLILMPGMIDIHLHGGYGYDFIRHPQDALSHIADGLLKEGTTAFMASLTVISHNEMISLLKEYAKLVQPEGKAELLGVHSEGPYLSKEYKALMDERYLRDPSITELKEMEQAAMGKLKIMTVAPELEGMSELIKEAKKDGLTIMIGHTACTCQEAESALSAGADGFTHLYNAMTQHLHRAPGAVTAAWLHPEAYTELIVDGFHVHPDVVRATWKKLGPSQITLITDAMLGKGMPDGEYVFSNLSCRKHGNTVQVIETGRIAGSAITMLDAITNMRRWCGCTLNELVQMACINPAHLAQISLRKGTLAPGKDADFILLDEHLQLHAAWCMGKEGWSL